MLSLSSQSVQTLTTTKAATSGDVTLDTLFDGNFIIIIIVLLVVVVVVVYVHYQRFLSVQRCFSSPIFCWWSFCICRQLDYHSMMSPLIDDMKLLQYYKAFLAAHICMQKKFWKNEKYNIWGQFLIPTHTLMAFTGVTNVHGPSPQPTANSRSPKF